MSFDVSTQETSARPEGDTAWPIGIKDPVTAIAELSAEWVNTPAWAKVDEAYPPSARCRGLDAIADALGGVHARLRHGIAEGVTWCADLAGVPPLAAWFAGKAIAQTVDLRFLDPLYLATQAIRAVGLLNSPGQTGARRRRGVGSRRRTGR